MLPICEALVCRRETISPFWVSSSSHSCLDVNYGWCDIKNVHSYMHNANYADGNINIFK